MRFIYPAVIKQNEEGTFDATFPDLECCEAHGPSLMEVLREANAAAYDWIDLELHEDDPQMPPATDLEDLVPTLKDGEFARNILVIYRMNEGWDE